MKYGTVLPHRSIRPLGAPEVADAARTAEALGFADLWVTDNALDHAHSFDPFVVLTYAAALTSRIRLGVSMLVLNANSPVHVAHQAASLDVLSGGRLTLGVALGRPELYHDFSVPTERPVRRFRESVEILRQLWTQDELHYSGEIFDFTHTGEDARDHGSMALTPLQRPHPPIWTGGASPGAIKRVAELFDGWMGAGGQDIDAFAASVIRLREALDAAGRDQDDFPISKRVFLSVADTTAAARAELAEWFGTVYFNEQRADTAGVYGTPSEVAEKVHRLEAYGANHLLLNPVARYSESMQMLAGVLDIAPAQL
jgi:probable F420-dependent oxidoreductase